MTRSTVLVALCSAFLFTACDKLRPDSESAAIERARALEAKGDFGAAILEIKNALQQNPQNVDTRLMLGKALLETGNGGEAQIAFKLALDGGADPLAVVLGQARALYLQGNMKQVLADVVVPPGVDSPTAARLMAIRGDAYVELGRIDDATKAYADALVLAPTLNDALIGQARVALARQQYDLASTRLQQILDTTPDHIVALIVRGDLERAQRRYDDAAATYQKVLGLNPNNLVALVDLTSMELSSNRLDSAAEHVAKIRRFAGAEVMGLYLQGLLDYRRRDYTAARESIQKVISAAPDHLPTIVLAGLNEFALNSNEQAEKFLRQALAASPNLVVAKRVLIATYLRSGQTVQAVELVQSAVLQTPKDPAMLTLAGEAYMKAGDYKRAVDVLSRAAALAPDNGSARVQLGLSRLAAGDSDAALADLETAARGNEDGAQAEFMLVVVHMARKDYVKAAEVIADLERKQPSNPVTYNLKGGLLLATKDMANARGAFTRSLTADPTYVPAAINLAKLDVADRNVAAAKKRFTDILDRDPRKTDASLALYELQRTTGAPPADRVATLERAVTADPKALKPLIFLSRESQASDPAKSLSLAKQAVAISPNDPDVLEALGTAQLTGGESRGALATYTKLVELNPRAVKPMFRLATLLNENANPAAAIRLLHRVLEIEPGFVEAQAALVSLELNSGNVAEAIKLARRVQVAKPQSPFGYLLEGDALMSSKSPAKAAAAYEKAYAVNPNGALAVKAYAAYAAAGQENAGIARLQDWLKQSPDDAATRYYLATAAASKRDYRLAIANFETIVTKDGQNAIVLNDLAAAYDEVNDARAIPTAESAYQYGPGEAAIADTLGWMLVRKGDQAKGLKLLRDAARIAPQVVDIRMHLVQSLLKTGDRNAARTELEAVVNRRENFQGRVEAERLLAKLQQDQEDSKQ